MSATENAFALRRIEQSLLKTVGEGSAAMTEISEALISLDAIIVRFKNSRVHAAQELEELTTAMEMLEFLTHGSNNINAKAAMNNLRHAKQEIENHINHISRRIKNLDEIYRATVYHVENNLNDSGDFIKAAVISLQAYRSALE